MQLRTQIAATIGLAAMVWIGSLFLIGEPLSWRMLTPFGATVTVVSTASVLFVHFAWRWPIFRRWLVQRPDLSGTWRCDLTSNYVGNDGKPVQKTVYVVIRQTLISLSFRLYSERAKSASIADNLAKDGTDLFALAIAYQNIPRLEDRGGESEIHFGSSLLTHIDYDCQRIEGHYWTDRKSKGSLVLLERRREQVSSFEEAQKLFASPADP
jgi:hypothetical protein